MKTLLSILLPAVFVLFAITTYGQKKNNMAVFYDYEVECMGTGMDGTQLLKVWGYAKKPSEAVELAKRNAVYAVMFKGILSGKPGCMVRPLITEAGSEQQHQDYFNTFFKKGGKYLEFVSVSSDGSIDPKDRLKVGSRYKIGVVVSVSHATLRKELEAAGIIKALGQGF